MISSRIRNASLKGKRVDYRSPAQTAAVNNKTPVVDGATSGKDKGSRWAGAWFRDSGVMLLSQGALTATATLVMILLARALSKYQFGLFSSFLGVAQALSFVVDAGLSTWLLRECSRIRASSVPRDHQDANIAQLLSSALSAVIYMGIVAIVGSVTIGLVLGLSPQLSLAQGAFMGYIALLAAATALEARLRSERRLGQVLSAVLFEKASMLVLVGVVLALGGGLLVIGAAFVLAGFLRASLDYRRSLTPLGSPRLFVKPWTIFPLLRVTSPFALNSAALSFLPRADTAVVATVSVVGASYYALGFQIVTTAALVPSIASITLLPLLTSHGGAQESRWQLFGIMSGIGVVAAGVGILLAPFVVPLLFGNAYRPAVGAIQIMLLAIPSIFACNAIMPFLYNQGHEHDVLRWVLLPSALGTCFVLLGEIVVGPKGASLGLVARYLLITISFVCLSFRTNPRLVPAIPSDSQLSSSLS
jgi:O-antigen/teichoic acid export membrane protein